MFLFINNIFQLIKKYLFIFCFLFFYQLSFSNEIVIDRVIAIVDDDVILESELTMRMIAIEDQLAKINDSATSLASLKKQIVERLILEILQLQLAKRAAITVNAKEIDLALNNIAAQNNLSLPKFKTMIETNMDFQSFKQSIEQELIIQRLQQAAVERRIKITDQDITNFLHSKEGEKLSAINYHVAHILIPFSETPSAQQESAKKLALEIIELAKQGADFQDLAKRYSKSPDARTGGNLGWRKKSQLPSLYASEVEKLIKGQVSQPIASDKGYHLLKILDKKNPAEQYIQQSRVRHILIKPSTIRNSQQALALATSLKKRIDNENNFEAIAKEFSEDYTSALKGGDLGWSMPGKFVPEFDKIMNNTSVNVVSNPFQTQFGWHILQILERRNQDMSDAILKQSAKRFLQQRLFQDELQLWLQELQDEAYIDIRI